MPEELSSDGLAECNWNSIAYLLGNRGLGTNPERIVRKTLKSCGFKVCDGPIHGGMDVASLLGLEELCADGD